MFTMYENDRCYEKEVNNTLLLCSHCIRSLDCKLCFWELSLLAKMRAQHCKDSRAGLYINITKSVEAGGPTELTVETRSPLLVNVSPKAEQPSETVVGQGAFKCNQLKYKTFFVPTGVEDNTNFITGIY